MRIKKLLTILSLLLMLLLAALATHAYTRRAKPILFRIVDQADPVKTPSMLILNSFRDRGAEGAATAFLEKLKAGQCQQAVENLYDKDAAYRQYICERESKYPLQSWSLADREEQLSKVRMYFWNNRPGYNGEVGQLWMTAEKQGNQWRVINYECWY